MIKFNLLILFFTLKISISNTIYFNKIEIFILLFFGKNTKILFISCY